MFGTKRTWSYRRFSQFNQLVVQNSSEKPASSFPIFLPVYYLISDDNAFFHRTLPAKTRRLTCRMPGYVESRKVATWSDPFRAVHRCNVPNAVTLRGYRIVRCFLRQCCSVLRVHEGNFRSDTKKNIFRDGHTKFKKKTKPESFLIPGIDSCTWYVSSKKNV